MAITIQNLRIVPYSQKNELKCVWGDTLTLTFTIPHVAGESYVCGIDNDRVVYPPSRPVCAYTNVFTRDGNDITFKLPLNTSKFRSYVSTIRKPMPVWLQVCRVGLDGKCETLVLDDILAIPSVLDATNTVCEGDPLKQLLDGKMDKPAASGSDGQVLTMDADGHYAWADLPHIPEDPVQSDWDESDSSNLAYIKHKPVISKVGHTGEYNDILNRPDLKPVATTGSYNDLTDKPHIPVDPVQADYDESDSGALDYIKHKPNLSVYSLITETGNKISMSIDDEYDLVVNLLDKNNNILSTQDIDLPIESMIVDASYSNGVLTLTLQNGNTVDVDISDIVSGLVPDSRKVNGHALDADVTVTASDLGLATVATSGSYDDLLDKPAIPDPQVQSDWDESDSSAVDFIKNKPSIPAAQVQSDWDESDSTAVDYIKNKPAIPAAQVQADYEQSDSGAVDYIRNKPVLAAVATTGNYWSLTNRPAVPYNTGDYFTIWNNTANSAGSTVVLEKVGSPRDNTFQYCTNGSSDAWSDYTLGSTITIPQYGYVKFRNKDYGKLLSNGSASNYYHFVITGNVWLSGNLASMKDRTMSSHAYAGGADLYAMFKDNAAITDASGLIIPINDVNVNTYASMFENCTGMVYGPAELPAMKFSGVNCYMGMFKGCTSLKVAPRLPAVTLTNNCYMDMFNGCTSLIEPPPELPAPVLLQQSYRRMFNGCTALKKSPDIKATTLANSSMYEMFSGCSALNEVKIAFSDFAPTGVTTPVVNWMASTGTGVFRCPAALSISTRGASTVPSGWMVDRIDDPRSNWDESDSTESAYVMNKPVIPSGGGSDDADYLCFTALEASSTVRLDKSGSPDPISLEYSTDKENWTEYTWSSSTGATVTLSAAGDRVWFRATSTNSTFSKNSNYYRFVITKTIAASGNIMSLLDKSCKSVAIPSNYCFYCLFINVSGLKSAPELPATTLSNYCYQYMFYGCTSLKKAPDIKAISLADFCCWSMFQGCSSLTKASELTSTVLASNCYRGMFNGCTSLVNAPELPATTLSNYCYCEMFQGCTSLVKAPKLPATKAFARCYENMFNGCTSLVNAPELPATTLEIDCYNYMFKDCTSLKYLKLNNCNSTSILSGVTTSGVLVAPDSLDVSGFMPANWTKVDAANSPDDETTSTVEASSGDTFAVCPGQSETGVVTVTSSLTLTAPASASTDIAYAEVVIDLAVGATVTAGSNLTLVDTPTDGKRNVCVVRWQGGTARLYVVDTMDLPA